MPHPFFIHVSRIDLPLPAGHKCLLLGFLCLARKQPADAKHAVLHGLEHCADDGALLHLGLLALRKASQICTQLDLCDMRAAQLCSFSDLLQVYILDLLRSEHPV